MTGSTDKRNHSSPLRWELGVHSIWPRRMLRPLKSFLCLLLFKDNSKKEKKSKAAIYIILPPHLLCSKNRCVCVCIYAREDDLSPGTFTCSVNGPCLPYFYPISSPVSAPALSVLAPSNHTTDRNNTAGNLAHRTEAFI